MFAALNSKHSQENLDRAFRYYITKHDFTRTVDLVTVIGRGPLTRQVIINLGKKGLLVPSPYKRKLTIKEKICNAKNKMKDNLRSMFCSMTMRVLMVYKNIENFGLEIYKFKN